MPTEPGATPPLDLGRIVESLERHGVSYVIVGGVAGRLHGASRLTFDLDVLARRDVENLDRVAAVLRELGAFLRVGGPSGGRCRVRDESGTTVLTRR